MKKEIFKKYFNFSVRSLSAKIVFLACVAVFLGTFIVGMVNYYRTVEIASDAAIEGLAGETRLASLRFKGGYNEMKNDAFIISRMPSIEGVIQSIAGNSSVGIWRDRLAIVFSSIIKDRDHYKQIRLIGVADGGKEIVRVRRLGGNIEVFSKGHLKRRNDDPYFKEVINGRKGVYFSRALRDKELVGSDEKDVLIIRAFLPIFHKDELFGVIVIDVDYDKFFVNIFKEIKLNKNAFVLNDEGNHMEYYKDRESSDAKFHDNDHYPDFLRDFFASNNQEDSAVEGGDIFYGVKVGIDESDPKRFFGVVLKIPYDDVMEEVHKIRYKNAILGILIIFISLLLTALFAIALTNPLRKMTREILLSKNHKIKNLDLPLGLQDETGDLARAFKNKAEELALSEEKLQAVIDNIVDGIITVDKNGKIDSYSQACNNIFGYQEVDALGKSFGFLLKDPDCFNDELDGLINKRLEFVAISQDGREFPLEVSISRITLNSRDLYCLVVRDITEIKQVEDMKNEFISTINHEIRTPLTSIQGSLILLQDKMKSLKDRKIKSLIDISRSNSDRLLLLVNDILDIEKMAAGRMNYDIQRYDIYELVKIAVEKSQGYAQKYNIQLKLNRKMGEVYCRVDADRFEQAINNLLSNAVKYSPRGGKVTIKVEDYGKTRVKVSVCDKGSGIPKKFYDKIFHRFSQSDDHTTRKKGGTGLGLSIVKSIVKAFKGKVDFESEEGKGSTFYIILPKTRKRNVKK